MRPRTSSMAFVGGKAPGPGTYEIFPGISPKGSQFVSKFMSSCVPRFNPPHSKRFNELRIFVIQWKKSARQLTLAPGPGQYQPLRTITETGTYFVSKLHSSQCRRFGTEVRDTLSNRGTFIFTPGPGNYRIPSEFGQYEAAPKYIEESKRLEIEKAARAKTSRNKRKNSGLSQKAVTLTMTRSSSQPTIDRGTAPASTKK